MQATLLVVFVAAGAVASPKITIVYPNEGQTLPALRYEFIHGNISGIPHGAVCSLTVNDVPYDVHEGGGFLAYVPVTPGAFSFEVSARIFTPVQAKKGTGKARYNELTPLYVVRSVTIASPLSTIPKDSLAVGGDFDPPSGNLSLVTGDKLDIRMRGTPACNAWLSIAGVCDSLPMLELPPQQMNYAGEGIFSRPMPAGGYEVGGVYAACVVIEKSMRCDTARVQYFITPKPSDGSDGHRTLLDVIRGRPSHLADKESGYTVTVNSPTIPRLVRFKDSVQTLRVGPRKGYATILQPSGIEALATGAEGNWLRLELAPGVEAWIADTSVVSIANGALPRTSEIGAIRMISSDSGATFLFPLTAKHPFRITEVDRRTVTAELFGVTSNLDWIRYVSTDSMVDFCTWSQPHPETFQFTIHLNSNVWGYETTYWGNVLALHVVRPPKNLLSLGGKVIAIDPGHSKDPGARGPTEFIEAEANLAIALKLRKRLEARGARVYMTRSDDSNVPLADRPALARNAGADLFVSVHNNSCPDGVNPRENNGTAMFYYHPHSMDLARSIHKHLVEKTGLKDHGVYHGNLAVIRASAYPAVLVESAFMIIPEQEALLKTSAFQTSVAEAIALGIEDFFKRANHGR